MEQKVRRNIEYISSLFWQLRLLDGELQRPHEGAHDTRVQTHPSEDDVRTLPAESL